MIAAGLLAKKAVEKGLSPRPGSRPRSPPAPASSPTTTTRPASSPTSTSSASTSSATAAPPASATPARWPNDVSDRHRRPLAVAVSSSPATATSRAASTRSPRQLPHERRRWSWPTPSPATSTIDFDHRPLGQDKSRRSPVFLRDIWPTQRRKSPTPSPAASVAEMFTSATTPPSPTATQQLAGVSRFPSGDTYGWEPDSTYIRKAPYFDGMPATRPGAPRRRHPRARVLAVLGDSVTTDHISPAGSIKKNGPAGTISNRSRRRRRRLQQLRLPPRQPRSHGPRDVRQRASPQQASLPAPKAASPACSPKLTEMSIYDASVDLRRARHVPSAILAGKEYGSGSAPATGPPKARACSASASSSPNPTSASTAPTWSAWAFCRFQFLPGESAESLSPLRRRDLRPRRHPRPAQSPCSTANSPAAGTLPITAPKTYNGKTIEFSATLRIDTPQEILYYQHGGILQYVLRQLAATA